MHISGQKIINVFLILIGIASLVLLSLIIYFSFFQINKSDTKYTAILNCGNEGMKIHLFQWKYGQKSHYLPTVEPVRQNEIPITKESQVSIFSIMDQPQMAIRIIQDLIKELSSYLTEEDNLNTDLYIFIYYDKDTNEEDSMDTFIKIIKPEIKKGAKIIFKGFRKYNSLDLAFYKWIYLNYFEENFQNSCGETINIIDLDQKSIHMAFEVSDSVKAVSKFQYKCQLNDKMTTHYVFTETLKNLGVYQARDIYRREISHISSVFYDDCLPKDCEENWNKVPYMGTGKSDECLNKIKTVFDKYFSLKDDIKEIVNNLKINFNKENQKISRKNFGLKYFYDSLNDYTFYTGPWIPKLYSSTVDEFCQQTCGVIKENMQKNLYDFLIPKDPNIHCFRIQFLRYFIENIFPVDKENPVVNHQNPWSDSIDYTFGMAIYLIQSENK